MKTPSLAAILLLLTPLSWSLAPATAQEPVETAPLLTIESIHIEPESPAADTLCRLRVRLRNQGSQIATQLDFKVAINGQELPVYKNQLFMFPAEGGKTAEIPLYNFWSTETSRPFPADGKLTVQVRLESAQWTKIGMEGDVEVWEPLGPVEGLPTEQSITVSMQR